MARRHSGNGHCRYLFFGLASVFEGLANTVATVAAAAPAPFFGTSFFGFLTSRLALL